ncbi:hypothetical protein PAXRUDRAFT_137230, partial [Paxillus rubicundulus Ve08.2h10]
NNIEITVLHVPETKTKHKGEDLSFLQQAPNNPTDPWAALDNHFAINEPPLNLLLFFCQFNNLHCPLTKVKFTQQITEASKAASLEPLQGHRMCIGRMLEYLMWNVSFETVKAKGCCKSNAFQLYLCKHVQILAVHMQKHLSLHEEFIHYTMPTIKSSGESSSSSYYHRFLRCARHIVGLLSCWGLQLTSSHTGS